MPCRSGWGLCGDPVCSLFSSAASSSSTSLIQLNIQFQHHFQNMSFCLSDRLCVTEIGHISQILMFGGLSIRTSRSKVDFNMISANEEIAILLSPLLVSKCAPSLCLVSSWHVSPSSGSLKGSRRERRDEGGLLERAGGHSSY